MGLGTHHDTQTQLEHHLEAGAEAALVAPLFFLGMVLLPSAL